MHRLSSQEKEKIDKKRPKQVLSAETRPGRLYSLPGLVVFGRRLTPARVSLRCVSCHGNRRLSEQGLGDQRRRQMKVRNA